MYLPLFLLNSFIFTISILTFAVLLGNIAKTNQTISALGNVIGIGTSFLAGAFVPVDFLPEIALRIAMITPSYWYINSNSLIANLETFNLDTLKPIILNMSVILLFIVSFVILNNIIVARRRKKE